MSNCYALCFPLIYVFIFPLSSLVILVSLSLMRIPFSTFWNAGLVVMDLFKLSLCCSIYRDRLFFLSVSEMSLQVLQSLRFLLEKSALLQKTDYKLLDIFVYQLLIFFVLNFQTFDYDVLWRGSFLAQSIFGSKWLIYKTIHFISQIWKISAMILADICFMILVSFYNSFSTPVVCKCSSNVI